ncbi:hypothetical protein [Actinomadura sp. 6N118]|uniref:hypothetical protein n=1 Tax=Actinomadura sp. 6N118 TaxID=3375151 RepID=UPI00378FEE27
MEFKSDFAKHHQALGRARGKAKAILKILKGRHVPVSEEVCERVISCTDEEQLDAWVTRALTAERAEDLFV